MPDGFAGQRLDKALAALAPEGISRSRLTQLIRDGAVTRGGVPVTDPKAKVKAGEAFELTLPPVEDPDPQPKISRSISFTRMNG